MSPRGDSVRRVEISPTDADGAWTADVPVEQIPAVIGQLAALQLRLVARWLAETDRQPSSATRGHEELLTMTAVAETLDVPVAYARELGRRGELPVIRVGRKYVRVRRSVLDAWIAQREDRHRGGGVG